MKFMLIMTGILILVIITLIFLLRNIDRKLKSKENQINNLLEQGRLKDENIKNLMGEIEIEKEHNAELAKKLADISCMSIDDVLHELQHNEGN